MERQKKVVDASVIVKWFVNEDKSDKALELKEQHIKKEINIIIPPLVFLEVLNTLRFKEKNEELLEDVIKTLWDTQFSIIPLDKSILSISLHLSLEYDLTIYDAFYAALSQIHNCSLITCDEKLTKFPNSIQL